MNNAVIVPTGDELVEGIVFDTNGPAIREIVSDAFPNCHVKCEAPLPDSENAIGDFLTNLASENDMVVFIGGSGGGRRHSPSLASDCTHIALTAYFEDHAFREIYGMNGHLWCKIVVGKKCHSLVFNVPGPPVEAVAAARAAVDCLKKNREADKEFLADRIAAAVLDQYPRAANHE